MRAIYDDQTRLPQRLLALSPSIVGALLRSELDKPQVTQAATEARPSWRGSALDVCLDNAWTAVIAAVRVPDREGPLVTVSELARHLSLQQRPWSGPAFGTRPFLWTPVGAWWTDARIVERYMQIGGRPPHDSPVCVADLVDCVTYYVVASEMRRWIVIPSNARHGELDVAKSLASIRTGRPRWYEAGLPF